MVKIIKSLLVLASFFAAGMWALDPAGIYEPLIVFLTAGLAALIHFSPKPKPSTLTIDGQPLAFDLSIDWNESPPERRANLLARMAYPAHPIDWP